MGIICSPKQKKERERTTRDFDKLAAGEVKTEEKECDGDYTTFFLWEFAALHFGL